jgi:hypothetical protein
MFNRIYPAIDRPAGASVRHWIVVLETVAKSYPSDALYFFGHGSTKFGVTGKSSDLLSFRDYLSGLLDYTQKKIKAGEPKEKIVTLDNLPGFPDFHAPMGPTNRLPANLGVAYDELTEKNRAERGSGAPVFQNLTRRASVRVGQPACGRCWGARKRAGLQ